MHRHCTTQVTLVLGGLLGQDVTLEGLTALDGATGTNAKTLLRAALGLHFGHLNAPVVCAREAARNTARTCNRRDRKSTRLNSSHLVISYAVFCLKKKTPSALAYVLPRALARNIHHVT